MQTGLPIPAILNPRLHRELGRIGFLTGWSLDWLANLSLDMGSLWSLPVHKISTISPPFLIPSLGVIIFCIADFFGHASAPKEEHTSRPRASSCFVPQNH